MQGDRVVVRHLVTEHVRGSVVDESAGHMRFGIGDVHTDQRTRDSRAAGRIGPRGVRLIEGTAKTRTDVDFVFRLVEQLVLVGDVHGDGVFRRGPHDVLMGALHELCPDPHRGCPAAGRPVEAEAVGSVEELIDVAEKVLLREVVPERLLVPEGLRSVPGVGGRQDTWSHTAQLLGDARLQFPRTGEVDDGRAVRDQRRAQVLGRVGMGRCLSAFGLGVGVRRPGGAAVKAAPIRVMTEGNGGLGRAVSQAEDTAAQWRGVVLASGGRRLFVPGYRPVQGPGFCPPFVADDRAADSVPASSASGVLF